MIHFTTVSTKKPSTTNIGFLNLNNKTILTRDQAEAGRLKRYFTGTTCRRGHLAERYTSNGACVRCLLRTVADEPKPEWSKFLPLTPFVFQETDGAPGSEIEAQAVFRYMADKRWHLEALKHLRADPALMAKYDHEPTMAEKFT
jgi:hypothetical protein